MASKITIDVPIANVAQVRGAAGAVESSARVRLTNVTAGERTGSTVRTSVDAQADGSFATSIAAQIGDRIEFVAIDAAGNESVATAVNAGPALTSLTLTTLGDVPQTGVAGHALPDPIQIQVTAPPPHGAIRGLTVVFEVRTGGGTLSRATAVTNGSGIATTELTLGAEGAHEIAARLEIDPSNEIVVPAQAVGAPRIDSITPAQAEPGQTVEIRGANFSPIARHDVVSFGSQVAVVREASSTRLVAEVPIFAADGAVTVTLTGVSSNGLAFDVLPVPVDAPPVGDVELVAMNRGDGTVLLRFEDADTEYLLVLESTSPTSATFSTTISGDRVSFSAAAGRGDLNPAMEDSRLVGESLIRQVERDYMERLSSSPTMSASRGAPRPAQDLGSKHDFFVVGVADRGPSCPTDFEQVTATLRFKDENTLIYVDDAATAGSITDAMLNDLGRRFDDQIYPRDVGAFGEPSDEDDNDRVIILLSPSVNALTTQEIFDQGSRIVGFFFGPDLLGGAASCLNDAEVFYSIAPDPDAIFGAAPSETGEAYVDLVTAVAAHEFQHMISFNWHVCKNVSPCVRRGQQETLWLDEGLSHMAEAINDLHVQNQARGALFLATPYETSLVGDGNELDERGASYLFVQYMVDRFGEAVLRRLVDEAGLAGRTGIANVDFATDTAFTFLFHQWAAALFLDGPDIDNDPIYEFPSRNLRNDFLFGKDFLNAGRPGRVTTDYLDVMARVVQGSPLTVVQKGTSPAYVRVTTPGRANVPITIDGASNSELQVTVIRTK